VLNRLADKAIAEGRDSKRNYLPNLIKMLSVMYGLGNLTSAQLALAEFLEVDPDLLAGTGIGSPEDPTEKLSEDIDRWIDALPRNEIKTLIRQLFEGKGHQVERIIRVRDMYYDRFGESTLPSHNNYNGIEKNKESHE